MKIVGAEHKILARKHKNSNNIPNTFYVIQKSSNTIQIIPTKQNIILTRYKILYAILKKF